MYALFKEGKQISKPHKYKLERERFDELMKKPSAFFTEIPYNTDRQDKL